MFHLVYEIYLEPRRVKQCTQQDRGINKKLVTNLSVAEYNATQFGHHPGWVRYLRSFFGSRNWSMIYVSRTPAQQNVKSKASNFVPKLPQRDTRESELYYVAVRWRTIFARRSVIFETIPHRASTLWRHSKLSMKPAS